ncbi:uncharacterized protein MYCFIDRAFT_212589 [Pseudocercospora fijiensis CIRAD86]|uniref:Uncharacterized protein n=1 Tax=Pseudocercospora fijiensis (strain CIRAD86) TaxID=383855 RepID=M3A0H2_PSEFD|nr:uncharacterized protein MYCFIDRAFT_212589 [Pseudocercospora fijiensis CIRAD86]EME77906.1 hypothetical protein MYCFIDRAFT_212589 [Pseudocercospora fijiensis CIRAD86]
MADFLTNLWESVFTPGTTPTLLVATNCTFGALQILLLGLLAATYSIHFAILSVLCGGLWYSINWFAVELQAAQKAEVEAERLRKKRQQEKEWSAEGDAADDEGENTETEGGMRQSVTSLGEPDVVSSRGEPAKAEIIEALRAAAHAPVGSGDSAASGVQPIVGGSESRQRRIDDSDKAPSEFSTDSEWEKVDEGR